MTRENRVVECLFCGHAPCTCNTKSSLLRPPKVTQALSPDRKSRFVKSDVEPTPIAPPEPVKPQPLQTRFTPADELGKSQSELALETAIRNLSPILSAQEKLKYQAIVQPLMKAPVERRLIDWRERNGILCKDETAREDDQ